MSSAPTPFPNVRRLVTGHTESGHSTFETTDEVEPYFFRNGKSLFTDLFWSDNNRPDLSGPFEDATKAHPDVLCGKDGFTLKVVDTPPGGKSVRRITTLFVGGSRKVAHRNLALNPAFPSHGDTRLRYCDERTDHTRS